MGHLPSAVAGLLWCLIALGSFVAVHAKDSLCLASSGTATWCTPADTDCLADIALLVGECSDSSRLNIVIDGLYTSQLGDASANATSSSAIDSSIEWFVRNVTSLVGSRQVLYILEPYALTTWTALSKSSRSDELNSFAANMELALKSLSANANAQVYLGLGSSLPESDSGISSFLNLLVSAGTLQGVVLDGSMGNSVEEIADVCSTFRQEFDVAGSMSCIIDTSAVIATASSSSSQSSSSLQSAGSADAVSPTADTGLDSIAYFVWLTSPDDCSSDEYGLTSVKYDADDATGTTSDSDSSTSSTASSSTSASALATSKATPSPSSTATPSSASAKTSTPSPTSKSAASNSSSAPSHSAGQNDDLVVYSSASSSGLSISSDSSKSSTSRSSGGSGAYSSTSHHTSSATTEGPTVSTSASSASASNEANAYSAKRSDGTTSNSGSTTSTTATTVGKSTDAKIGVIAVLGVLGVVAVAVVFAAARRAQQQPRAPSPPRYRVSSFLSSDVVFLDTY